MCRANLYVVLTFVTAPVAGVAAVEVSAAQQKRQQIEELLIRHRNEKKREG